ncbi:DoxX family protein [Ichthyenterobacterium sp. W332]|uniref:DoxX family protein n=1 Tax=Microcosmobacter mediterraneus TaxID=3075607 RepID=A0ABU2YLV6_9FLAO|nr:DoxX family protein [Ichthyenterobacterium sp. W332]MDT0558250.1 DoxX family protein [Ichthyenterobacterium sp. W332]
MNYRKISYWVSTIIVCSVMLYSATMYFTKTEMIKGFFESFNYPTYLVIPLAIAKVLGIVMLLWRYSKWLTEWAYAGFFFDLLLASAAHYFADHGIGLSVYTIPFLLISYFLGKEIRD